MRLFTKALSRKSRIMEEVTWSHHKRNQRQPMALDVLACRGVDRKQFSKFLQAWCLQGSWGLKAISDDLLRLLRAPDYLRHAQVHPYVHLS